MRKWNDKDAYKKLKLFLLLNKSSYPYVSSAFRSKCNIYTRYNINNTCQIKNLHFRWKSKCPETVKLSYCTRLCFFSSSLYCFCFVILFDEMWILEDDGLLIRTQSSIHFTRNEKKKNTMQFKTNTHTHLIKTTHMPRSLTFHLTPPPSWICPRTPTWSASHLSLRKLVSYTWIYLNIWIQFIYPSLLYYWFVIGLCVGHRKGLSKMKD